MAHTFSAKDSSHLLTAGQQQTLLEIARSSIRNGLDHGRPLKPDAETVDPELLAERASFVTLEKSSSLRGCIGHLEAFQPLLFDVAENAFAAAFQDPRFPPLREDEYPGITLHISILSPPAAMTFNSEQDLIDQLVPGEDGLILRDGRHRGTFLPSVWEQLPDPGDFLRQLKLKAGLPAGHWSPALQVQRYTTESFGD